MQITNDRSDCLLDEGAVAAMLHVSLGTIRRWRLLHAGPRFFKIGVSVRYKPEDVQAWIDAQPSGGSGTAPIIPNPRSRRSTNA